MPTSQILLILLGFAVGAYGTLIGAGGGFVLVPILLLLYPSDSPDLITSISLAVVFFNAASGTVAYARMGRVDFRSGLLFAAAAGPGAVLGALTTGYLSRQVFDTVLGVLMIAASIFLVVRPLPAEPGLAEAGAGTQPATGAPRVKYNRPLGLALAFVVGYASGLLGIGGGIIHVPMLVQVLGFPVHIATATSHFILALVALAGTGVHVARGVFVHGLHRTVFLSIGVLLGAQLGARLSQRIHGAWIVRALAIALAFVGLRVLWGAL